eukprot:6700898-Heterocapsa_arctica.AAC.1
MMGVRVPLIEGESSDVVAMLSQNPPPSCACSETMWMHVAASGYATWRCPSCRNELQCSAYLR